MTAAITEVDDPVNKTLAIGLFTFIFVSVGLYAVYFFIISRYLRGRWARNNGVQLIKSDRDLGRQTRDVFDLAGWDHCAYDVLIIPTNAGNAKYYEVRWFTRDSQGSLGSSEGRKVQHSKAYFYYPLPGFLPYITIDPPFPLMRFASAAAWSLACLSADCPARIAAPLPASAFRFPSSAKAAPSAAEEPEGFAAVRAASAAGSGALAARKDSEGSVACKDTAVCGSSTRVSESSACRAASALAFFFPCAGFFLPP